MLAAIPLTCSSQYSVRVAVNPGSLQYRSTLSVLLSNSRHENITPNSSSSLQSCSCNRRALYGSLLFAKVCSSNGFEGCATWMDFLREAIQVEQGRDEASAIVESGKLGAACYPIT